MCDRTWLEIAADWAAILTALGAGWVYSVFRLDMRNKRLKLERHLKAVRNGALGPRRRRTVMRLMQELGLTEAEVLQASFRSKVIRRYPAFDPKTGRADAILFEYDEAGHPENIDEDQ